MLIFAREASYSPRLRFERVARETGAVDPGRRGWLAGFAAAAALAALGRRAQGLRAQPGAARMQPVGVIGAGHIGGTIGGLWVQAGHPVLFSSRHPDELRPLAQAGSVAQAIAFADVVLLAVPYKALPEIARDYGRALSGKVVIDATNAFRERDGNAGALALRDGIGITTARFLPGARGGTCLQFHGGGCLRQRKPPCR